MAESRIQTLNKEKGKGERKEKEKQMTDQGEPIKVKQRVSQTINKTKERGKHGLIRVVFSRTFVIFALLILQVVVLFSLFYFLADYYVFFNTAFLILGLILVIHILNTNDNPMYSIAWIIPILVLPVFGCTLYLFVKLQVESKLINRKLTILTNETREYLKQDPHVIIGLEHDAPAMASLAMYIKQYGGYPVDGNTAVKFFPLGEDVFAQMVHEIRQARKFIFMEFFIVAPGYMWDTILDLLVMKVAEGVEVRFMYDGTNSLSLLPYNYPRKLARVGINCKVFSPIRPLLTTSQNNRDHRKVMVVDGKVAFTGGINLADEYINKKERFGHWKDTMVMLKGQGVRNFTIMFLQMWNINANVKEDYSHYVNIDQSDILPYPGSTEEAEDFGGVVCGYGDSPLDKEDVGEQVYLHLINNCKHSLHIMTPYLIIGPELEQSLEFAAKRGVDVKMILPHIPDKKYAFLLAKTYYKDLVEAGVNIYEYTPGFVHAKEVIADEETAIVGTINMDFRSLFLHFECAALIHKNSVVAHIEEDYRNTLRLCQKVTKEQINNQPRKEKLAGEILKLIAPMM